MPNAGQGLKRLSFKQEWDVDLRDYMKKLDAKKPVILCGDLNVAHLEIGKCSTDLVFSGSEGYLASHQDSWCKAKGGSDITLSCRICPEDD